MSCVAMRAIGMLQTFDTSGTVREARGLASRTYTLSFADGVLDVHHAARLSVRGDASGVFLDGLDVLLFET